MFENCLARSVSASIRSVILKVRHAVREYRGSIRLSLPFKVAPKSDFAPGQAPCPPSSRNWPLGGPRHKASAPGDKESLPRIHASWNPSGPSGISPPGGGPGARNFRKQLLYFAFLRHDATTTCDRGDRYAVSFTSKFHVSGACVRSILSPIQAPIRNRSP